MPTGDTSTVKVGWLNLRLPGVALGPSTITYQLIPGSGATFGLTGPSVGPAKSFSTLPAILRLNRSGYFDASNGLTYAYAAKLKYQPGVVYTVRMVLDPTARTYNAFVRPAGGIEVQVARNFAFRRNTKAGLFTHLALNAVTGTFKVYNTTYISRD